jgi:hypothetical protein
MSKLNFAAVDKAFELGSSQIKDTQEEISQLTKLILESNNISKKPKQKNLSPPETAYDLPTSEMSSPLKPPQSNYNQAQVSNYMRIGYPDQQRALFSPNNAQDDIDFNLMKVVGHPKFDDIVKNYALINHPEWLLRETVYKQPPNFRLSPQTVSYFGNKYQSTVCSDVKNYVIFFVASIMIFLLLTIYLK